MYIMYIIKYNITYPSLNQERPNERKDLAKPERNEFTDMKNKGNKLITSMVNSNSKEKFLVTRFVTCNNILRILSLVLSFSINPHTIVSSD